MTDLFPQYIKDVESNLKNAQALYQLWEEDPSMMTQVPLLQVNDQLKEDARNLETSIHLAESNLSIRQKFGLDDAKLSRWKAFVSQIKQQISSIERKVLFSSSSSFQPQVALNQPQVASDEMMIQQQQQLIQTQDRTLDEINDGVSRIKNIAKDMHQELEKQNDLIIEIDKDADKFSSKLKRAQCKIEKLLLQKDNGKLCLIFLLLLILIVLMSFLLYL
jgi:hypothetical protein